MGAYEYLLLSIHMQEILRNIYYSFPVQLLLISIKKYPLLLAFWVVAFLLVTGHFGRDFGIPYLFLDPEYLDHTGYVSFVLVGIGFGMFYISWNLNCYMLHSYRFRFMSSFQKPMGVFFLNNSLLPLSFIVTYLIAVSRFQIQDQYATYWTIVMSQVGFVGGFALIVLLAAFYFTFSNKASHRAAEEHRRRRGMPTHFRNAMAGQYDALPDIHRRVDFFFTIVITSGNSITTSFLTIIFCCGNGCCGTLSKSNAICVCKAMYNQINKIKLLPLMVMPF